MILQKTRKFIEWLSCILLLGLGRASWFWYLAPITAICGYALAWHLCASSKRKFLSSLLIFSGANFLHLSWLLSHPYSYIYFIWIIFSVLFAIPFALLSLIVTVKKNRPLRWTVGMASLFSLLEWSYTLLPCGYAFQSAALHLTWSAVPLQLASCIGGLGLSFLVYWTNLLVFLQWQGRRLFILTIIVTLFPYLCGSMLFWQRVEEQKNFDFSHSPLRVALCQMEEPPDVFSKGLSPEELHVKEWTKIFSILSTLRAGQVDLIILPEGAVPFPAQAALYDARRLPEEWLVSSTNKHPMLSSLDICRLIAWSKQSSILIGLEGHTLDPFSRLVAYNSMYCISPKQKKITRYDKQLLIPLGEYIPSEQFRTWLSQYGIHESFTPGEGPVLLTANTIQIAPFICYEEIFSSYVVEAARLQPNLLTSVSNDNWFPSIRTEHFELARLRTAEVGIPLLRSCNQGVSAAIDSLGRTIVSRGETQEKDNGYIIANVSLYSAPSFFLEFGNEFIVTILAFIAIVTLTPVPKKQKHLPLR